MRTTERVVEVRCHSTPGADIAEVVAQGYLGAIREANGVGAKWIQNMGIEAHENRSEPVCITAQTRRSRRAQAFAGVGQALADANQPTATATCTENFNKSVKCEIYQRPTYRAPLPASEYESTCDNGRVTGQDTLLRYELLSDAEAQARGGVSEKPYRDTVDAYREAVKEIWADKAGKRGMPH